MHANISSFSFPTEKGMHEQILLNRNSTPFQEHFRGKCPAERTTYLHT
jgi:hypothetical protein